jgi:hypothetical protein
MTGSIKVRHLSVMIVAFMLCALLTGCGGGPTKAQYEKLKDGMSLADARKEMGGDGTELKKEDYKKITGLDVDPPEGLKIIRWGDDNKHVVATFVSDKLVYKKDKGL